MLVSSYSNSSPINRVSHYILIHGAWHGSWCWNKIVPRLQSLGHTVVTPDLPGHYKNVANFKDITLKSYIDYVQNIISQTSSPVVLVGHSMAGVIITQVAENIPDKIDRLIYISGFIPENGGSLLDEEKKAANPTVAKAIAVDETAASIALPMHDSDRVRELFYANCNDEDARFSLSRLQTQPLLPFLGKISTSDTRFGKVPKLYIECLKDKAIMVQDQRRMHARTSCETISIDTDHSPFFSAVDQLAISLTRIPHHRASRELPIEKEL